MESIHPATPWVCGMGTPSVHPLLASIGWSSPHPRVPATLPPYGSPDLWNPHSACLQGPIGMKGVWTSALSSSCLHTALLALCPPPWPLATFTGPPAHGQGARNCSSPVCSAPFPSFCHWPPIPPTSSRAPSTWRGSASSTPSWQAQKAQGLTKERPRGVTFTSEKLGANCAKLNRATCPW